RLRLERRGEGAVRGVGGAEAVHPDRPGSLESAGRYLSRRRSACAEHACEGATRRPHNVRYPIRGRRFLPKPPNFCSVSAAPLPFRERDDDLSPAEGGRRYRTLIEQLPLVVYVDALDAVSSNISTSPQIEPLLGYSVDEWKADTDL